MVIGKDDGNATDSLLLTHAQHVALGTEDRCSDHAVSRSQSRSCAPIDRDPGDHHCGDALPLYRSTETPQTAPVSTLASRPIHSTAFIADHVVTTMIHSAK